MRHNMVAANWMSSKQALGGKAIHGDEYPLVPITAGIPPEERALIHAVPFNDLAAIDSVAKKYEIAAIITEPVLQNIGVIQPQPGYLEGLRNLADQFGCVLILDEVKTGFRAAIGGYQQIAKVTADLSTYGKALANGFPIAAMAGKSQYMDLACSEDLQRRVLIAGTYNCHPVPVAAAIACLKKLLDPRVDAYGTLEKRAQQLECGQAEMLRDTGFQLSSAASEVLIASTSRRSSRTIGGLCSTCMILISTSAIDAPSSIAGYIISQ